MHSEAPASNCPQGLLRLCLFLRVAVCYTCDDKSEVAEVTEMKNRIIGVIFLIAFVSINLWAILTKNYSNSFLAGIAAMCLVTAILYFRKGKR